jgi:glycosyltransferase involved in cell wall biosynthesis
MIHRRPRLLQVANVGEICGGTAACAWSVTRALPGFEHHVAFLSPIRHETARVFAETRLHEWARVDAAAMQRLRPDIVLLHNTAPARVVGSWSVPTVLYRHSSLAAPWVPSTVYCSRWLADQCGADQSPVLWQGVPRAPSTGAERTRDHLVIGRLCSPQVRKWPTSLIPFYRRLAIEFPRVCWEFVGCPLELQTTLQRACRKRAVFWTAGWERRALLHQWDGLLYHQPDFPESFGRTVAEGLRAGCLPIVDRLGGFIEQLSDGGGWLCDDLEGFITAIAALHDEPQRRHRIAQGQSLADDRWSLRSFATRLITVFEQAAGTA